MKWINIKNQLPNDYNNNGDKYNCVLVYSSFNGSIAFAQYLEDHWRLLSDGIYSDAGAIGIEIKDITHWMKLPKSPKEQCYEVIKAIKNPFPLTSQEEKWINIQEKEPEFDQVIIGTDGKYTAKMYKEKFTNTEYIWRCLLEEDITHWMPLPEKPNEVV